MSDAIKAREPTSDFDPVISSSVQPITNLLGHYIVCKRRDGTFQDVSNRPIGIASRLLNPPTAYFEIVKQSLPFVISFRASSSQIFRFSITLNFEIQVSDPVAIAEQQPKGLRCLVDLDLQRLMASIASRYQIDQSADVMREIQDALNVYKAPSPIRFRPGVVSVVPDGEAAERIRQIDIAEIEMKRVAIQKEMEFKAAAADAHNEKVKSVIEDHHVEEKLRSLSQRQLPSE